VRRRLPPSFLIDDLIATGNLALTRAATRYSPHDHGGTPFSAFARPAIRGAMIDTVRRKNWTNAQHESLDADADGGELRPAAKVLPCDVATAIDSERLRRRVKNAAEMLPDEHRQLLAVYYSAEEPTLPQAARWMRISLRRATDLHREAVDQLRLLLREPA
jgi:RNA polymerase sigma factor (sigma-70 family)